MRIVSLLPSATEIVYALGLGEQLVGVTHECDFPADARTKPVVTTSVLDHTDASSEDIDHAVSAQIDDNLGLYTLNELLLAELQPDLILTQALCAVCAVDVRTVERAAHGIVRNRAGGIPRVLTLEPSSLADVLATVTDIGAAAGVPERAALVTDGLRERISRVTDRVSSFAQRRPRVACLEWVDPLFGPGHWLPELVSLSGGTSGLGTAGAPSRRITWTDVIAFAPEVMVISPCGMGLTQAVWESKRVLPYRAGWSALPAVRGGRVYAVDGNSYFSRPGPRLVESLELLAELIHPDLFAGWGPEAAWEVMHFSDQILPNQLAS